MPHKIVIGRSTKSGASDLMRSRLHAELDEAIDNICHKMDAACGKPLGEVELELTYRRDLGKPGEAFWVDYFYISEVSQAGVVESGCSGQTVWRNGEKYEV